jgi:hypothetical protein
MQRCWQNEFQPGAFDPYWNTGVPNWHCFEIAFYIVAPIHQLPRWLGTDVRGNSGLMLSLEANGGSERKAYSVRLECQNYVHFQQSVKPEQKFLRWSGMRFRLITDEEYGDVIILACTPSEGVHGIEYLCLQVVQRDIFFADEGVAKAGVAK